MTFSQIAFRVTFVLLAVIYLAVITDFLNPQTFNVHINVRYDAVALSALVVGCIYMFFRRS
jgi:hypothetical protein